MLHPRRELCFEDIENQDISESGEWLDVNIQKKNNQMYMSIAITDDEDVRFGVGLYFTAEKAKEIIAKIQQLIKE